MMDENYNSLDMHSNMFYSSSLNGSNFTTSHTNYNNTIANSSSNSDNLFSNYLQQDMNSNGVLSSMKIQKYKFFIDQADEVFCA
jgi:hypothetical protein